VNTDSSLQKSRGCPFLGPSKRLQ